MPVEERCEISDLPKGQCAHCRPRPQPDQAARARYGPWTEARFTGECAGPCGGEIRPGEMIRSDGEGGWLCQRCGS